MPIQPIGGHTANHETFQEFWEQYTKLLISNPRLGVSRSVSSIKCNYQIYIGAMVRCVPISASRYALLSVSFGESRRSDSVGQGRFQPDIDTQLVELGGNSRPRPCEKSYVLAENVVFSKRHCVFCVTA